MSKPVNKGYNGYLNKLIEQIERGEVEWVAFSAKFVDGGRVAIHSKDAPNRPMGMGR